jgi:putative transposase
MDTSAGFYQYRHLTPKQRELLVRDRQQHGHPWHAPPHPVREATYYLFTAANFEHSCIMATDERRIDFQGHLLDEFQLAGAEVSAWVILPNHYHFLAFVPDFDKIASRFQHLHGPASRRWNLEDDLVGRKVWYRYSDRAIRSERHFYASMNYIHYNPIKHGWVSRADEWVCSSIWPYLETEGRGWLKDIWREYPPRDYGKGWDW